MTIKEQIGQEQARRADQSSFPPPVLPTFVQPATAPASAQAPKKKWPWVVGILIVLAVIGAVAGNKDKNGTNSPSRSASTTHRVTYKTSGSAPFGDITYETPSGTAQQSDVDIPLTPKGGATGAGISFTMREGDFVYISIQNGTAGGTVSCAVEVDGVQVLFNTSQGAYAIATCSGSL